MDHSQQVNWSKPAKKSRVCGVFELSHSLSVYIWPFIVGNGNDAMTWQVTTRTTMMLWPDKWQQERQWCYDLTSDNNDPMTWQVTTRMTMILWPDKCQTKQSNQGFQIFKSLLLKVVHCRHTFSLMIAISYVQFLGGSCAHVWSKEMKLY